MYERFTDRARQTMQLANQEAQRFNHEYIGTEHILLGLVKQGSNAQAHKGVGGSVLQHLGIDLRKVRLEVEKLLQSGPDMVTMGKLPQTPRTKKVIQYAIEISRERNDNYVGTDHLLLALLREKEGAAYTVLESLGVTEEAVNAVLEKFVEETLLQHLEQGTLDAIKKEMEQNGPAESAMRQITKIVLSHLLCFSDPKAALAEIRNIVK